MRGCTQVLLAVGLAVARVAVADGTPRVPVDFLSVSNVGLGRSVFVVGGAAELGTWSPVDAVKLRYAAGDVWTGRIALAAGETVEFKYVTRLDNNVDYCSGANVAWPAGANLATSTPSIGAAPYAGKTIYYYSGWTQVLLIACVDGSGTNFGGYTLTAAGPGRTGGEFLYRGTNLGFAGGSMEFVLHNGAGAFDRAPYPGYGANSNYFTRLDAFVVQDGQVYNYWPAPSVSPPRIVTNFVNSTAPDPRVSGRVARIYLPRGYDDHAWKRYPVMYFHDGQQVFQDSRSASSAANSWQVDYTATREISQGRLREAILVGLDNTGSRQFEYEAPGDTYPGQPAGIGDAYLHFLVNNARPTLDFNYRTLSDPRNTLVGGSSMGGLISVYAAYETNVFGGVLAMSPAITRAPTYKAALPAKGRRAVRIYMDTGSAEGQVGPTPGGNYWEEPWSLYDLFLAQGYAVNDDLLMRVGCGAGHNELAWRARVPGALAFLLDVREEPSPVLAGLHPPSLEGVPNGVVQAPALRRHAYRLETTSNLAQPAWQPVATSAVEQLPWGRVSFTNPPPDGDMRALRAVAEPRP